MSTTKSGPKPLKPPPALNTISSKPIINSTATSNTNTNINNNNGANANNLTSTTNSTTSFLSLPTSLSSSSSSLSLSSNKPSLNRPQSFQHIPGVTPTETVSAAIDLNQLKHGRSASHYFSYVESVNLLARGAKFVLHEWDDDFNDYSDDNSVSKLSQSLTTELETPVKSRAIFLFYKSPFEIEKARKDSILDGNIKLSESDLQFHESSGIFFWNYSSNNRTMVKSRSLPVSCITDVFMGKQAPIFSSPLLTHLNEHNCFSIIGSQALFNNNSNEIDTEKIHEGFVELDLEASNTETATNWLLALNSMLSYSGTQVHYDDPDNDEIKDSTKKQIIIQDKSTSDILMNKVIDPSPSKSINTTTPSKSNANTTNDNDSVVIARSHSEFDSSAENSDNEDSGPKLQIVRQLVENTLTQTSANKNPPGSANNNNDTINPNMGLQRPKQVSLFLKDSEPNSAAVTRDPDTGKHTTPKSIIPIPIANNNNSTGSLSIPATIPAANHVEDDEEEKRLKLELESIRAKKFIKSQSYDAKLTSKPKNFTPVKSNSNNTPTSNNTKKAVLSGLKARITPLVSPTKKEEEKPTNTSNPSNTDSSNANSDNKPAKASILSIRNKPKLTISAEKRRSLIAAMKNTDKLEQLLNTAPQSSADIKPEAVLEFVETPLPIMNRDKDIETDNNNNNNNNNNNTDKSDKREITHQFKTIISVSIS